LRESVEEEDYDEYTATVQFIKEERDFATLIFDETAGKGTGYAKKPTDKYNADIVIRFHKDEFWRIEFNDAKKESELFTNPRYDFEKLLFQMKSGGTKVEFDMTPDEIEANIELDYGRHFD